MKNFLKGIILPALLSLSTTATGGSRPDLGLKPVDDSFLQVSFLAANAGKFTRQDLLKVRAALDELSDDAVLAVSSGYYRDPMTVQVVSILAGILGLDRFLLGQPDLGVLKLISGGGLGIWYLIDVFNISGATKRLNYKEFSAIARNVGRNCPGKG